MSIKSLLLTILFISQLYLIKTQIEDPDQIDDPDEEKEQPKEKKPKRWTTRRLYRYLNETYLHKNNPNYDENIKFMIFDPENYIVYEELEGANNMIKDLYEKYNFSTHIFFISHIRDKHKTKTDHVYSAYVDRLSYLIYREHPGYNENMTLTAVFFIKDNKMKIRTTKELRKYFSEAEITNMLNKRKKDFNAENYREVAYGIVKDIYKTYTRKVDNPNENLILIFTVMFVIGLSMLVFLLNREQASPHEERVKLFLDKIRKKENLKDIFVESCIICLGDFKSSDSLKNKEITEKKELLDKEETSVLECGHKFHRKCISDWIKKEEKCPLCKINIDIQGKDTKEIGRNTNFANILTEILRIQSNRNILTQSEISRINRLYHPKYRIISNVKSSSNSNSKS